MNSIKCVNCGLSNFSSDLECRRCHKLLYRPTDRIASNKPPRRNALISLLIFAALAGGGYYIYLGLAQSVNQVSSTDLKRVAAQPANQPDAGLSRAEADRQKSQRVGNFVGISPGLNAHTNRTQQTQQTIEQLTNSNAR
ncbi:MAG: hypothetical protein PSX80_06430 [bacterium]|nr:hypothetical protein [bacterium]